ncbi:MAG: ABC transporter substrate-binding protein [Bacteroidales bacterium]|nr:ABC transporter substrate-binding protein [Bacteroidales bacterium]MCF8327937.1 ABC transporter substrate-binding protein [Bacteroidales bacterium]
MRWIVQFVNKHNKLRTCIPKDYVFAVTVSFIVILQSCNTIPESGEDKQVFRYNQASNITSLDPAFSRDQANIWAVHQMFNGLVQLDSNLNIKPSIAKDWTISEDGTTYTFYLRNDVMFHNHKLFQEKQDRYVTAQDFVYSFNRLLDPKVASPGAWVFNNVKQTDSGYAFKAIDDTTLQIELEEPFPPFLGVLTMKYCSVVPKEIVEEYKSEFRKNPVGTGPFYFKMWEEDIKLVMLKNPDYFEVDQNGQQLPYLDAVSVSFIIDKQSVFMNFIKGDLDFLSGLDASYKDELLTKNGTLNPKYKDDIKLLTQPYLNTEYLGFLVDDSLERVQNSPLRNKKVRQAINYGFDRKKMMRYLRNNIGTPALSGFVPEGLPSFDSSKVKGYHYNPQKARRLLKEAGYPNGEGMSPITLSTTSSYLDLSKFIQHQLQDLGLEVEMNNVPPATLREMIAQSKLNFFRGSWIADYPDAENYLSLFYSANFCPTGPNYTHFANEEFDSLYEKAQHITNDSIRFKLYRKMDKLVMEEAPVVVLYYDQVLRFVWKNIEGLGSNPLNLLTLKYVKKSPK